MDGFQTDEQDLGLEGVTLCLYLETGETRTLLGCTTSAYDGSYLFDNLAAVAEAAGGTLSDVVKVNISLTDLADFTAVNEVMAEFFAEPYPARACVQVAALPKAVAIEVEAIIAL